MCVINIPLYGQGTDCISVKVCESVFGVTCVAYADLVSPTPPLLFHSRKRLTKIMRRMRW